MLTIVEVNRGLDVWVVRVKDRIIWSINQKIY